MVREELPFDGPRPCANCARPILFRPLVACYCTRTCLLAAAVARGYRRLDDDGRLDGPLPSGLRNQLRELTSPRHYQPPPPAVPLRLYQEIGRRFDWCCARCGNGPASHVAPFPLERPLQDAAEAWLLCEACFDADGRRWMAAQRAELSVRDIHARFVERATSLLPRQPSDSRGWNQPGWLRGAATSPGDARTRWDDWRTRAGWGPACLADIIAGFPSELDAWTWFAP